MRIDLNPKSPEAVDAGQPAQSGSRAVSGSAGRATSGEDTAHLSLDQARVGALAAQVNNLPEVRQEKVDALSRAVRDGSYNPSAEKTAAAMIAEMMGSVA